MFNFGSILSYFTTRDPLMITDTPDAPPSWFNPISEMTPWGDCYSVWIKLHGSVRLVTRNTNRLYAAFIANKTASQGGMNMEEMMSAYRNWMQEGEYTVKIGRPTRDELRALVEFFPRVNDEDTEYHEHEEYDPEVYERDEECGPFARYG